MATHRVHFINIEDVPFAYKMQKLSKLIEHDITQAQLKVLEATIANTFLSRGHSTMNPRKHRLVRCLSHGSTGMFVLERSWRPFMEDEGFSLRARTRAANP